MNAREGLLAQSQSTPESTHTLPGLFSTRMGCRQVCRSLHHCIGRIFTEAEFIQQQTDNHFLTTVSGAGSRVSKQWMGHAYASAL